MELTPGELFDKYAALYTEKYMDVTLYAHTIDIFCDALPASVPSILDIACGPGNMANYVRNKINGCRLVGIDLAPNMVAAAAAANPGGIFLLMDCRQIRVLPGPFDGIICAFLMPYLTKAEAIQLINDAAELLGDKGVIYISAMEGENTSSAYTTNSGGDSVFINYHEASYLANELIQNGLDVISVTRMDSPANSSFKTNDIIIIAKKV